MIVTVRFEERMFKNWEPNQHLPVVAEVSRDRGKSVVLTTYLTGKPDPQARSKRRSNVVKRVKTRVRSWRGGVTAEKPGLPRPNDFSLMQVWYESLIRTGCEGVIFHDELSPSFVARWTHSQVQFQRRLKTPRSVNDERYLCYLEWLEAHQEVERIYLLDLFDVEFFKDPFLLMDDAKYDIYCGRIRTNTTTN